jgi:hypothetical protein
MLLDEHEGWKFWRFDMRATLGDKGRVLKYHLDAEGVDKTHWCALNRAGPEPESPNSRQAATASQLLTRGCSCTVTL